MSRFSAILVDCLFLKIKGVNISVKIVNLENLQQKLCIYKSKLHNYQHILLGMFFK